MSLDATPTKPWNLEAIAEEKGPLKGGTQEGELVIPFELCHFI